MSIDPGVAALYDSDFVRHYDLRAQLWEHLVCREATAAFHHRLRQLADRPLRVLDLGCGTGRNLHRFAAASLQIDSYVGVDFSRRMIDIAHHRHPYGLAEFRQTDVDTALATEERYDLITATWLLSHHHDPADLIRKATECLDRNGRFLALAITAGHRPSARIHGWRFKHSLHSLPVQPELLRSNTLSFEHISASGLVTLIEHRPPTPDPLDSRAWNSATSRRTGKVAHHRQPDTR